MRTVRQLQKMTKGTRRITAQAVPQDNLRTESQKEHRSNRKAQYPPKRKTRDHRRSTERLFNDR